MSENQDLFDELRAAILAADNPKDRAMLLIMQRVLARVEEKLDDDERIRDIALNGHADRHHIHHDFVEECIQSDCAKWIKAKKLEEEESAKDKKSLSMKFLEAIVSHIGTAVAVGLIAYFTLK